jgi:hypothetical protein
MRAERRATNYALSATSGAMAIQDAFSACALAWRRTIEEASAMHSLRKDFSKLVRCAALLGGVLLLSVTAHADDRRDHGRDHRWEQRHDRHDRHDRRSERGRDWRYHNGRYWAPLNYRGRYCNDRRHYRGAHYHVAANDYYRYYYPRYQHYGPLKANASVIISLPLF